MDNIIKTRPKFKIKIFQACRDISNWFFIRRTVKRHRGTPAWTMHNLTHDWFYRIGAVVNMRQEDFGEQEEIHLVRTMSFLNPIFEYISETLELGEILYPDKKRIEGAYSYLVTFHQVFIALSFKYVVSRMLFSGIVLSGLYILGQYLGYIQ